MNRSSDIPNSWNLPFVEELYSEFARDPASIDPEWRDYFAGFKNGAPDGALPAIAPAPTPGPSAARSRPRGRLLEAKSEAGKLVALQNRVIQLVRNYRVRGHNIAAVDPLKMPRPVPPELELSFYGFSEEDLDIPIQGEPLQAPGPLTVRQILQRLQDTYCRSIGVQFMHIDDFVIRRWLQQRMESTGNRLELTRDEQVRIFTRLTDAVTFEEFIRKKFVGAKSFSLEGCESLIPLLDLAIEKAAGQGIKEIVLGMAHRGRLNVLANILGKSPRLIFREFADDPKIFRGHGDVKYHLGYSNEFITASGQQVHLSLCFNPSHLEFVNPVVMGRTRIKQDRFRAKSAEALPPGAGPCMALMIHGDASFAGEGIVQETLNLSQLAGYTVGGSVHVIVNNQIGFTTSPAEARSFVYPTEVARMLQSPIFHVNGEDPEAVAQVVRMAMDFRQQFQRDVFIDMFGYRRLGHNEGDEPSFTQPVLYKAIDRRKSVREGYLDHLLTLNELTREEAAEITQKRHEALEQELSKAQAESGQTVFEKRGVWTRSDYTGGPEKEAEDPPTGLPAARLAELLVKQTDLPADFHPHPKIKKFLEGRRKMAAGEQPLDWSAGEALAFASLSVGGARIRLSGQDSGRGTFSQRHAVLYDYDTGAPFTPLQHLAEGQGKVDIINSPLSEGGVLGFDYGYSLDCPDGLVCWEAQFGDFVNAAQVVIDQFIASAEDKWDRLNGLVLLLPHGFEGQGPEHSSARLERFMALAAQDNIQIVCPTTPAQYFHCLRRQIVRRWRKPLVVMTPKSLLRDPRCVSTLAECADGKFQRILPDSSITGPVRRVLLCTGKIYYELLQQREALQRTDVAIIRLEQLYPFPESGLHAALDPFPEGTPVLWVQEEPENMGAWRFIRSRYGECLFGKFPFSGIRRPASASPATGSLRIHKKDQKYLIAQAFADA